ncbi:MAG: Uma2 family endonuclease, partial [Planctomycetaceae bacterium]
SSPPVPPSRTPPAAPSFDQRIVIPGLTWQQYVAITDALPDRPGIRTAFDGENLELMTTSAQHERVKRVINRLIEFVCMELGIEMQGGGITTFRSEAAERGLEPDECYWIAHVDDVIGIDCWDAAVHPPPDLAVEVDIASKSIGRLPIYAKLQVPEVWRYDGRSLTALARQTDGTFAPIERSRSFPFLTVSELLPFVEASRTQSESAVVQDFAGWVRRQQFSQ